MNQVKAYIAASAESGLAPGHIERRAPRADDVVIEIKYCGICHTDVSQSRNEWGWARYPMVPGHEIVGVVSSVGAKVTQFKVGDRVGVGCFVDGGCSKHACSREDEHRDLANMVMTYGGAEHDGSPTYGGYSQSIVVKENYVLHIPEALPLDAAAPLLCAGITTYSPLRHWNAGPGKKVAIVGVGGLGHLGVKIAAAMGAEVTAISQTRSKEADAKRLGAHHFIAASEPGALEKAANSFDLILVTIGGKSDWNAYLKLLRMDGAVVLVGIPDGPFAVDGMQLISQRKTLSGSGIGSIPETQEMLNFCAEHKIVSDIELTAIQKIPQAYERILKSDVRYRFVIDMASLNA